MVLYALKNTIEGAVRYKKRALWKIHKGPLNLEKLNQLDQIK